MITIDLQDDDVTRTKKASRLRKDRPPQAGGQVPGTTTGENRERRAAKPGLVARLLKVIFKEL